MKRFFPAILAAMLTLLPSQAAATWSIIAVDTRTGLVVIASATCVTAEGLRTRGGLKSIQAIVVPGVGVAAARAIDDPWPPLSTPRPYSELDRSRHGPRLLRPRHGG